MASITTETSTKKIVNPRVEIDTSPPFESVKEAVDRFGGSGPFFPNHLLHLTSAHELQNENEAFNVVTMEEQAIQLERDLVMKEQETLNVLKELEAAKRLVEDLKINLIPEFSSLVASPYSKLENSIEGLRLCPDLSPGLMFMELNQAKSNLNKTSIDLAAIQSSIESLNKKMRKDKALLEKTKPNSERVECLEDNRHQRVEMTNTLDISMIISKEVSFEADQFKKITEASRYEVMKAMTEIEQTKSSIKMAEMRLNAAKKMEEAAKAVEAIAIVERKALLNGENSPDGLVHKTDGITLSFEEYRALTQRAQQADELCKTKFIDANGIKQTTNEAHGHLEVPAMEKFEQATNENKESPDVDFFSRPENKFKFRNSHHGHRNAHVLNGTTKEKSSSAGFWSKTSIGDVLSRKLTLRDDVVVGRHVESSSEREHISLSQMLREQSRVILHPTKETGVEKGFIVQRKKFGFIQVPIPIKQSKKKSQPVNVR